MGDPLAAISPLDGRYAGRTAALSEWASESALMRARVQVEVEYLIALAELDEIDLSFDDDDCAALRSIYETFDAADAALIKQIETTGAAGYPATNHDVKAVEYFLRERIELDVEVTPWIHFSLTSEDVNNLAYRILIRGAMCEVIRPAIREVRSILRDMAAEYRSVPMLARTHGQPATPTTVGKEFAVYVSRLDRGIDRMDTAIEGLAGKLAGASGTYAAHHVAFPNVDWPAFAAAFVARFELEHVPLTTQVNPSDDLGALFDAIVGVNQILLDLDRDLWLYISDRYFGQSSDGNETGSSTMPHKVNPIDFENSEGNLSKANADLRFLADYLRTSRLQRDLSDSTVKRNMGAALAHCLIGYQKSLAGLEKVVPNETVIAQDLADNPAVIAEAIQTVLRREGDPSAYERLKSITRGESIQLEDLKAFVESLDVPADVKQMLEGLEPATYTGVAASLVDTIEE